ncbi:MAG TPA: type II secretion system F family protein [Candidatus Omnitrophica bacterium]|nr:type II secretion system F family protein [Candidatus Omnitrophota bacterium]
MPFFRYKVRDRFGAAVTGLVEAETLNLVALNLRKLGYSVIDIAEQSKVEISLGNFVSGLQKIKKQELILFTRQISAMMKSGLTLIASLEAALSEVRNKKFRDVILSVKEDVEGGASFNQALAKHPLVFSDLFVNMVKVGESAGILDEILDRLTHLGVREMELRTKIKAAFAYPTILVVLALAVIIFLLVAVLPKFIGMFEAQDIRLPLPTLILITISSFLRRFFVLITFGLVIGATFLLRYIKTDNGKYKLHSFILGLPIFGNLWLKILIARFAYTLAALTKSGIPILQALAVVEGTVGNVVIVHALQHVRSSLTEGQSLAEPFKASGIFPAMVVQMISAGEKTGKIDVMLEDIAEFYELETGYAVRNMTAMLEPALLLIMGFIVGFIALSVLLPIFNVVKAMQY